jgi:hypothetical protein
MLSMEQELVQGLLAIIHALSPFCTGVVVSEGH